MMRRIPWSDLPQELLEIISRDLSSSVDVVRFRSVCKSWRRSCRPLFQHISSLPSLKGTPIGVTESTVYRLEPIQKNPVKMVKRYRSMCQDRPPTPKGWLIRIVVVDDKAANRMRLLTPLSNFRINPLPETLPKVLSLDSFHITTYCRVYSSLKFEKLVFLSWNPVGALADSYSAMGICSRDRKLYFLQSGDEEWTEILARPKGVWSDVLNYKGRFYAVSPCGETLAFDASSRVISDIASPFVSGFQAHLVESCGELLLVERYKLVRKLEGTKVAFRVYKLNEGEQKWVALDNIGPRMLFVGRDCSFSASARDFPGCEGNTVYFADQYMHHPMESYAGFFSLETRRIRAIEYTSLGYSFKFCQPSTWINGQNQPEITFCEF